MKKIYRNIFLISLLIMMANASRPQETMVHHKNFIGLTLTELPFVDFRFSYERRMTPVHGVKVELGYKPAFKSYTDATNIDLGLKPTAWCYRNTATWYYLGLGYRFYFGRKKIVYISPEFFYKHGSADMIAFTYGINNSSTITNDYSIRSMTANITGMNFLIGKKMRFRFSQGFNMGFDFYTGFTVRYRNVNETIFGSTIASYYHDESPQISIPFYAIPKVSIENRIDCFIQFGIVFYGSWK